MSEQLTLSRFLQSHRSAVLSAFVTEMTARSGALDRLPRPALLDHLPAFLEELSAQIDARASLPPGPTPKAASQHGVQRLALGYDLETVVLEYEVLRSALVDEARRAGVVLTFDDLDLLPRLFSRAVAQAVNAYVADRDLRTAAQQAELDLLVCAGEQLTASLDSTVTMTRLSGLLVPAFADWCIVQVQGAVIARAPIAHVDPARVADTRRIAEAFPLPSAERGDTPGAWEQPQLIPNVEAEDAVGALDRTYVSALRALGTLSWMSVPIRGHGPSLGALTVGTSESGRRYAAKDMSIALEVARRAGWALENARLFECSQQERARVDALSRAKDEFVMVVSHELRTPINTIVGWTRLLRADALPEARRAHALEVIERSAAAQTQLVSDLLDISHVSTGRIRLNPTQVDLSSVIDLVLEEFRLAIDSKRIGLTVDLDRPRAVMRGDSDRLQQVVWNLVSNAVKFTPKGGSIQIVLRRVSSELELVVQDSGVGVPAQFLSQMFDPFSQSDMSTSRSHGGLGVGLAITQHLVTLHGGSIRAESRGPGEGVTMFVRFPVAPLVSPHFGVSRIAPPSAEKPSWPRGIEGLSALIVDDEESARDLLLATLEASGVECTTVASVQEALTALESKRFDVVVSDIGLGAEDGYGLIARIRGLPSQLSSTPAIALTGSASGDERTRALVAGFNAHLMKPVSAQELVTAIAELTGRVVRTS